MMCLHSLCKLAWSMQHTDRPSSALSSQTAHLTLHIVRKPVISGVDVLQILSNNSYFPPYQEVRGEGARAGAEHWNRVGVATCSGRTRRGQENPLGSSTTRQVYLRGVSVSVFLIVLIYDLFAASIQIGANSLFWRF